MIKLIDEIKKLIDEGLNYTNISKELKLNRTSLSRFCKKHGIKIKKKEFKEKLSCINCKNDFIGSIKDKRKFCSSSCSSIYNAVRKPTTKTPTKSRRRMKTNEIDFIYLSEKEFIELCDNSLSMSEASSKINISYNRFKKIAEKLGCFKKNQNWNKGKSSSTDIRIKSKYDYDMIFTENSKIARGVVKNFILKNKILEYECECCKLSEWLNKPLSLHLDHINGLRNDNRLENLRFLCPNCHSQTDTYCGMNVGKSMNKNINDYTIDEIIISIESTTSIGECLRYLGLLNTKTNKNRVSQIKDKYDLKYKEIVPIIKEIKIESESKISLPIIKICKCGKEIRYDNISGLCRKCLTKTIRKVERPSYKDLLKDLENSNYTAVGRKYGVCDQSIRKWIKMYEKILDEN